MELKIEGESKFKLEVDAVEVMKKQVMSVQEVNESQMSHGQKKPETRLIGPRPLYWMSNHALNEDLEGEKESRLAV